MATLKGASVQANFDWARTTYGDAVWADVLARLTEDQRRDIAMINNGASYDITLISAVLETLADIKFAGDMRAADRAFRSMGAHIAETSLTGLYSLFLRVAKPEALLKRIPTVIGTMYGGVTADIAEGADGHSATITMRGLGDLAYAAPRLCGWGEKALQMCGAKNATLTERNWAAGRTRSDELVFDARW